jgi:hypothetical protein
MLLLLHLGYYGYYWMMLSPMNEKLVRTNFKHTIFLQPKMFYLLPNSQHLNTFPLQLLEAELEEARKFRASPFWFYVDKILIRLRESRKQTT